MNRKLVLRVEPSFCNSQSSAEDAPVRLLRFRDIVSQVVRWEPVCILLEHPRLSPLSKYLSLVKVAEIAPFWCGGKVLYVFILSFFLKYDTPIKDFVFPTTVPWCLTVRFPHP